MYIAICDDQYDDVKQIENALLAQGYEVEVYETGESLLAAYEQQGLRFDALFLDLKLQTMEGFDLANAIYAIDDSVLMVFVTAYSQYVFDCFKCNPVWFLRKPINPNELNDALAHLAHRFKRQQRVFSFKGQSATLCDCVTMIFSILKPRITVFTFTPPPAPPIPSASPSKIWPKNWTHAFAVLANAVLSI